MENNKISKVFNDSVHGHIEMPPLLVKIIDTPEFQRLRNIKQLGAGYFVYPGASHNRFEHSIGVAHLAGKLVQNLSAQKDLGITEKDILCVQIAGLCHDLGHGPFSHTFDEVMKELKKKRQENVEDEDEEEEKEKEEWKHEAASVIMFEHLIEVNGIEKIMRDDYKFDHKDFLFIMEMIYGPNPPSKMNCCPPPSPQWPYRGRKKEKSFLYQIVANRTTGIDVDKMDYFSRDCLHLGMKCNFSYERYMMFARVCTDENDDKQICVRDKEAMNMYELFQIRYLIRKNACYHRVTKAVELMLVDSFVAAANVFTFGENNLTILEAVDDPITYTNLTDDILQQILRSSEPRLNTAKKVIRRILKRDLYTFIGDKIFDPEELNQVYRDEEWKAKEQQTLVAWLNNIKEVTGDPELLLNPEDFKIVDCKLNYGMKETNPVDSLKFYRKENPDIPIKLSREKVSHLLPAKFSEIKIMLFYKGNDQNVVEQTKIHVEQFWNYLDPGNDPIFAEVNRPSIYVDLADLCQNILCSPMPNLEQEIIKRISKQGTYKFIDVQTFRTEELEHLTSNENWRIKVEAWLIRVQEQGADQSLTADDIKVVSFIMPWESDVTKVILFYKGQPELETERFWYRLVRDPAPPAVYMRPTDEDLQNLNEELSISQRIKEAVSKDGLYIFIGEKTFLCEELRHLTSARQREDQRRAWLNHVQEDGGSVATEGFKVVLYCLPGQHDLINVMLFDKGILNAFAEQFWDAK